MQETKRKDWLFIMRNLLSIPDFILDLGSIFYGSFTYKNTFLNDIREDILGVQAIPTPADYKEALRNDLNLFLMDTRKAQAKIKKDIKNGKTAKKSGNYEK